MKPNKLTTERIEIKENEWQYYKTDKYVEPGEYIKIQVPYGEVWTKIKEEMKKRMPVRGCTKEDTGEFTYLVPAEPWIIQFIFKEKTVYASEIPVKSIEIAEEFAGKLPLRSYQREYLKKAFETLKQGRDWKRGLIAPLGAGKLLIALCLSLLGKCLYICPKHLKQTVKNECAKWGFETVPDIITPESALKFVEKTGNKYQVVIFDECLLGKNPESKRSQGVKKVCEEIPVVVFMTGTPQSARRGADYLGWLSSANPDCVPADEKYMIWNFGVDPYYRDLQTELGIQETKRPLTCKSWNQKLMSEFTSHTCQVIDAEEVMRELPEKQYQKVVLSCPKQFYAAVQGILTDSGKHKAVAQARTITDGFIYDDQNVPVWLNETEKLNWVEEFIEENPEEPTVIIANWSATQKKLVEKLAKWNPVIISAEEKNDIGKFAGSVTNSGTGEQSNLLILSANMAEGLNLQKARTMIFVSNSSRPVNRIQAEGRIWRQEQKNSCVFYDLICENTLDSRQLELIQSYNEESEGFILAKLEEELKKLVEKEGKNGK